MTRMALDVRNWTCPGCGAQLDRDVNAVTNILFWGQLIIDPQLMSSTPGAGGIQACGDTSPSHSPAMSYMTVSAKQEAAHALASR